MTTSCYPLSLVSAGACRAEDPIEHQVGRQVNSEWKHERQKCQEPKRWNSSLRSLTKPINPIDISAAGRRRNTRAAIQYLRQAFARGKRAHRNRAGKASRREAVAAPRGIMKGR